MCYQAEEREQNPDKANERAKKWRKLNPDKAKKSQLDFYYRNRESRIRYRKNWVKENPDKNKNTYKIWYERNSKKKLSQHKEWAKKNAEKIRFYSSKRRVTISGNQGDIPVASVAERELRGILFGSQCAYCGGKNEATDHVIPVAKGGTDSRGNLVPSCKRCNSSKNKNDWTAWYRNQKFYDPKREKFIADNIW